MPLSNPTIVVGAGPAGLGFANHYQGDCLILEAENRPGGLMRSKVISGYTFDWAGHIFFTQIKRIREWVESLLQDNFHWQDRESWVYSKKTYTRYPFQANTFGLPLDVVKECLLGLIQATYQPAVVPPENFKEWIIYHYGDGIAKHFMLPYNEKLWARDLATMDFHWLSGRVPKPGLVEFIDGALGPGRKDMGPNARFGYPLTGGTAALVEKLTYQLTASIKLNTPVMKILPQEKQVVTGTGETLGYENLVMTAPLPQIVQMTENVPDELRSAVDSLDYLSVLCVNVGVRRPKLTEKHWIYFPESDLVFQRIFVQGNASPNVCPSNGFSFTAEITTNRQKQVNPETVGQKTLDGLIQTGLIDSSDPIDVLDLIDIPVAYVVPTRGRQEAVDTIRSWYRKNHIHLCGRFAEWAYYNMDHALDAGWNLAAQLMASHA